MARYLVTGGCGFIGSHLVDALLARGHAVRVLDDLLTGRRDNLAAGAELVEGCVTDRAAVAAAMADVAGCFHLAAIASVERSTQDWIGAHRVNVTGAVTVLDVARPREGRGAIPVVYASSAAVYGDNPAVPLPEAAPPCPLSAYGADKLGCELHARVAATIHGVPAIGVRFFNIYGPRQDPKSPYSGVISIFCDRIAAGRPVTIHGDGGQLRDFVYVGDAVDALIRAMERQPAEPRVFNVCGGRPISIRDLAVLIGRCGGRAAEIVHGPARPGDIRVSYGDPAAAARALDFRAATSLADGLARTLRALADA